MLRAQRDSGRVRNAIVVGVVLILGGVQRQAVAEPLPVTSQPFPDLDITNILVNYTAATGLFTATGQAMDTYLYDGLDYYPISGGTFNLTVQLDPATGNVISSSENTISVTGTISGVASGTLLTGPVTNFGFGNAGDSDFEFYFLATSGGLMNYFSPHGTVALNAGNALNFPGNFETNFTNVQYVEYGGQRYAYGTGVADCYMSPEPSGMAACSSLGLVGVVCGACVMWRRKARPAGRDIIGAGS